MFDFIVEMDLEDAKLGFDAFSLGDITIKSDIGFLSSKGERRQHQSMMIFPTLTDFLYGIMKFIKEGRRQYSFSGVDSSFSFLIFNHDGEITITDIEEKVIVRTTVISLVQSVLQGVNKFAYRYRNYSVDSYADVVEDFYKMLQSFEDRSSDLLVSS